MPVQITINGENAAEAIREFATLSEAFNPGKEVAATPQQPPVTPAPQVHPQQQPVQQPVTTAPTAVPTAQPTQQHVTPMPQQQTPVQQPVPTTAPTYNMDQLAVAATQLMDAGRQQDLITLLQSFGAQSLMQIPEKQYGAFATKLREMGAKI